MGLKKDGNRLGGREEHEIVGVAPKQPDPLLPGMPPDSVVLQSVTATSGPLPDPRALAEYDRIHPGFAERIVAMAEKQAEHRQSLEASIVSAQVGDVDAVRKERRLGQVLGITAVLATLIVAAFVGTVGQGPWAASIIASVPMAGLVVAFMAGRSKPDSAKEKK